MVSALSASLLVSTTLIPSLSLHLVRTTRRARTQEARRRVRESSASSSFAIPSGSWSSSSRSSHGSYGWFRKAVATGEFPRWYSKELLYVSIGLPPGTDIEKTDGVIRKFEDKVLEADFAKEINTYISARARLCRDRLPPGRRAVIPASTRSRSS